MRILLFLVVLLVPSPAVAGTASHDHSLGAVVRAEPLPAALRLAGAGRAWKLWYVSTSWRGGPTVVTGTLSLPDGRAPAQGWQVVSFGHGFDGVADACAQSRTGPSPWERTLQERLIAAGYAVAVTDFEGIGRTAGSPRPDWSWCGRPESCASTTSPPARPGSPTATCSSTPPLPPTS